MSNKAKVRTERAGKGRVGVAARIFVPLVLCCVALTAAVGAAAFLSARSAATAQLDARSDALRSLVAYRLRHSPAFARTVTAGTTVAGARVTLIPGTAAAVADRGGERVHTYPLGPVLRGGGPAALVVAVPERAIDSTLGRAAIRAAILAAVLTLLLVVTLRGVMRRELARPLTRLLVAIEQMGAGRYADRIDAGGPRPVRALARALERLAATIADLDAQAATDPLTGVANRRFFHTALETELKRADRQGTSLSLVLLDLDGFKEINDTHGHPVGDGILQTIAGRLRVGMRATDVLARVGGDEFAILLPGVTAETALATVRRARADAGRCVGRVELSWCSGVAAYPHDADDASTLLECADAALYCAKSDEQPTDCLYDPGERRDSGVEDDCAAIRSLLALPDAIVPVYQPLVALDSGRVAGYEALARFPHPPARRPDEWFALAERCGLGATLEARAVLEALAHAGRPPGTFLSFNLSAAVLSSDEVLEVLPADLADVVIEITENDGATDHDLLAAQLAPLRARGARVAIDDAGTGYAGLQQLMRVQPDIIKLDRSLVAGVDADPAKAALIDSFVRFAGRTGAVVCAEGIETPEELKLLADLRVTYGQGFGLARPAEPWSSTSAWVPATVAARSPEQKDPLDRRGEGIAHLSARLAGVRSAGELPLIGALLASELATDEVCLLRRVSDHAALEALTSHTWLTAGARLELSSHGTLRTALSSREEVRIALDEAGRPAADLALLSHTGNRTMLIVPIPLDGEATGLLLCLDARDRSWSRPEIARARLVGEQLAPLLETLAPPEPRRAIAAAGT